MTTTPNWLDIMPAIPLARGVPIVDPPGPMRQPEWAGVATVPTEDGRWQVHWVRRADWRDSDATLTSVEHLRVDLDDPQGFGYALRWLNAQSERKWVELCHRCATLESDDHGFGGVVLRHALGETTDADRLALARALAEVQP